MQMRNILLIFIITLSYIASQSSNDNIENEEVTRTIDLRNRIIHIKSEIQIQNKSPEALSNYIYLIPKKSSNYLIGALSPIPKNNQKNQTKTKKLKNNKH